MKREEEGGKRREDEREREIVINVLFLIIFLAGRW